MKIPPAWLSRRTTPHLHLSHRQPRPLLPLALVLIAATSAATSAAASPHPAALPPEPDCPPAAAPHVDEPTEPYLYGCVIAGSIWAWKFRQKRRIEHALA